MKLASFATVGRDHFRAGVVGRMQYWLPRHGYIFSTSLKSTLTIFGEQRTSLSTGTLQTTGKPGVELAYQGTLPVIWKSL